MRDTGRVSRVYQDPDPGPGDPYLCPSGLHLAEKLGAAVVGSVLSLPAVSSYDLVSPIAQFLIAQLSSGPRPVPQLYSLSTGHWGSSAPALALWIVWPLRLRIVILSMFVFIPSSPARLRFWSWVASTRPCSGVKLLCLAQTNLDCYRVNDPELQTHTFVCCIHRADAAGRPLPPWFSTPHFRPCTTPASHAPTLEERENCVLYSRRNMGPSSLGNMAYC